MPAPSKFRGRLRAAAVTGLVLLLAAAAGFVAEALRIPLPWILGPLAASAAVAMAGLRPGGGLQHGRRFGQLVVGAQVGLGLTTPVLGRILLNLPLMVATALFAIAVAALIAPLFGRVTGVDRRTAYFAMMPGGLAEMANIGAAVGAAAEPIALAQTIRLSLVVCLLPPLVLLLDLHGEIAALAARTPLTPLLTGLTLACALAGVGATMVVRLNNPWMIGAIFGAAVLAATETVHGRVPVPLYDIGQLLIGISIGARFRREVVLRMLPVCLATIGTVLLLSGVMAAVAGGVTAMTGLDYGTAVLSTSVGGIAEMTVTAQTLHLDVALVTAFHFVRAVLVNGFAAHFWTLGTSLLDRFRR
ncbi:AbrB family transcriptional regulator [Rhodoplanes roseus]|uniref:AbrB family transcriptional regulator n=1 Tax=Rhodoplanes roseus TaxID=29409 RepID=A0A327L0K9_9BRAD|nr:AbrB family transcriptional regulator [Rhodoplanes roseus]RAI43804.1 hypothetical protein CH341_12510 [Rhodoplanes roseus]